MNNIPANKPENLIKPGDIFQLGQHRLICGDARDPLIVNKLLENDKIRLLLSDPPYSVDVVASKAGFKQKLGCPKDIVNDHIQSEAEYETFSVEWLNNVKDKFENKNNVYIFNADKMIFALRQAMEKAGFRFSQLLVWVKTHAVIGRLDYLPQHELIAYGWHGTHEFYKSKDKSLLVCPKPQSSKIHPTMKPVSLLRRLILNSSKVGDVVYDPFGGSGSTMMASEQTHRQCLMIEIDPDYCQAIIDRFNQMFGVEARSEGTYVSDEKHIDS